MLISEVFGFNGPSEATPHVQVHGITHAGVEIELENITNADLNTQYWQSKSDGSLRNNGREFVFNGPKAGKDLFLACVELDLFLSKQKPDGNWRCSTHVHVDMRDVSVEGLKKIILGYLVYEKFLFRLSGFHRYTNNFCAAMGFAQYQLDVLARSWSLQPEDFIHTVVHGWDKYSALNLKTLSSFGTIEFRLSSAEWKRGKLLRLINRFLALKDFCVNWGGSEQDLVSYLSSVEPKEIFKKGMTSRDLPEGWYDDVVVGSKLAYDLLAFTAMRPSPRSGPPVRTFCADEGGVTLPPVHKRAYIEALEQALGVVVENNGPEGMLGFGFLELVFLHTDYNQRSLPTEALTLYQGWEESRWPEVDSDEDGEW